MNIKTLALQLKPTTQYTHVKKWCDTLDRINDNRIKLDYITKAKNIRNYLLNSIKNETIQNKIITRVSLLATALEIDQDRLLAWIFLRAIISAQWFIEDKGNPDDMLNLASILYPLLTNPHQNDGHNND